MPVHNLEAEQAVLGACMSIEAPSAYDEAAAIVSGGDLYLPAHTLVWDAITELRKRSIPADPVLVGDLLLKAGTLSRAGGATYLHTLYSAAAWGNIGHHARIVADCATHRRLEQTGNRLAQAAQEGTADPAQLVTWAAEQVAGARDARTGVDVLTRPWREFAHAVPENRRMVVPGLLGEGDRIVLTGAGGLGKSTMLLQFALCSAAGLPPFDADTEDPFDPARVTIMDCENPDYRVKNRAWPMIRELTEVYGLDPRPNLTLGGHGNSLNLLDPRKALSLLRTIEHDKPDLLYIGPVYKLHNDDPDKELVVKKITDVLDSIREMGVSLITEAHHNKSHRSGGSLEPSGSNLWTWWPEFGLGLRAVADSDEVARLCTLERWRLDREASGWPHDVRASGTALPWKRAARLPAEFPEAQLAGYGGGSW